MEIKNYMMGKNEDFESWFVLGKYLKSLKLCYTITRKIVYNFIWTKFKRALSKNFNFSSNSLKKSQYWSVDVFINIHSF